jgi:molybdenum cofactor cytidylyltransferase
MHAAGDGFDGRIAGVILAAGDSTRMGRPKLLLPLGDRPLLQHVLDAAAGSCLAEIVLVLGADAEAIARAIRMPVKPPTRIARPGDPSSGQSGSLRAGLAAVDPTAVAIAVLVGDQPEVTAAVIDRVAGALLAGGGPVARPVYRTSAGTIVPGHPVCIARTVWPALAALGGDEGARALFRAHPDWLVEVPIDGEPPADVDTPADYRDAVKRWSAPHT